MVKLTDERVKLINEMLQSIRVIKLYAWEAALEGRVAAVRKEETSALMRYLTTASHLRELIFSVQPLVALVILCVAFYGMRDPLSLPQIFRVIAFLNITRFPLNLLGQAMKNYSDGMVSIQRLNRFFLLPILRNTTERTPSDHPKIIISEADFSWQDPSSSPSDAYAPQITTKGKDNESGKGIELIPVPPSHSSNSKDASKDLENQIGNSSTDFFRLSKLSFETRSKNELIAIIGPVGAGKSSFMSALLGEMISLGGTATVDGTLSYCAQTPWIQNVTLKQNVLFKVDMEQMNEERERLYQVAIDAAALVPDIKILPAGDMTESKSTNLCTSRLQPNPYS